MKNLGRSLCALSLFALVATPVLADEHDLNAEAPPALEAPVTPKAAGDATTKPATKVTRQAKKVVKKVRKTTTQNPASQGANTNTTTETTESQTTTN